MEIGGEQFCEKSAAKQVNIVRVVRWFHLGWTEFAQARVGLMIGDQLATSFIFSSFLAGTRRPQGCVTGQDCNRYTCVRARSRARLCSERRPVAGASNPLQHHGFLRPRA